MAETIGNLDSWERSFRTSGYNSGYNGLSGIRDWECYMLIKFGNQYSFGISGDKEYLVQLPVYPEQVTESIGVKWQPQEILGRSSPIAAYANTELKNVSFTLKFHRDLLTGSYSLTDSSLNDIYYNERRLSGNYLSCQPAGHQVEADNGPFGTRTWYVNVNKMLQMSCYPQYTSNGLIPPTTYFIFGQMILKGFVLNYSTTWQLPIINNFYSNNEVQIQMDCYPDTIIGAKDIIGGSGAMSTQNTYNTKFPTSSAESSDVGARVYNGQITRSNLRTGSSLGGASGRTT